MAKSLLLKPDDIRQKLYQRYQRQHKQWLSDKANWPLNVPLGIPTEKQALEHLTAVQDWQQSWLNWSGDNEIQWIERHWSKLGKQKLPEKVIIHNPIEIAKWIGEDDNWGKATQRYQALTMKWPSLAPILPKYFKVLIDYNETDYQRLLDSLEWLQQNPNSKLYIRQLPIESIHSKWLSNRKSLIKELVKSIHQYKSDDFYDVTGLKPKPALIRFRLLDHNLRNLMGGLSDLTISKKDLTQLTLPAKKTIIVENLETGLAFNDIPETIVIMGLGYSVDLLQGLPLLRDASIYYWGDIDTDGFAILNRLRNHYPDTLSILMDESTLLNHEKFWGVDDNPKTNATLPMLTQQEKTLYEDLCRNRWTKNLRLEQERITWNYAWEKITTSLIKHK